MPLVTAVRNLQLLDVADLNLELCWCQLGLQLKCGRSVTSSLQGTLCTVRAAKRKVMRTMLSAKAGRVHPDVHPLYIATWVCDEAPLSC